MAYANLVPTKREANIRDYHGGTLRILADNDRSDLLHLLC